MSVGGIVFIVNCVEGHSSLWMVRFIPGKVVPGCIRKLDMGLCESQQTVFLHLFLPQASACVPALTSFSDRLWPGSCGRVLTAPKLLWSASYPSSRNEARPSLCSAYRTVNPIMTSSYLFIIYFAHTHPINPSIYVHVVCAHVRARRCLDPQVC